MVTRRNTLKLLGACGVGAAVHQTLGAIGGVGRGAGGIGGGFNGFYPSGHWVNPTTAGFPWASGGGAQTAFAIYPRPDAETSAYARHRNIYYDGTTSFVNIIPIIARGGAFPYVYSIISAPANAGASLPAPIWQPNWTIADAIATGYGNLHIEPTGTFSGGTFQIRVTGQDGLYLDFTFTASTVGGYYFDATTPANSYGFVFLDPVSGADPGSYPSATGLVSTIGSPIKTLNWAFGATKTTQTYPNAILVLRAGTTPMYAQDASYGIQPVQNVSPMAVIGFPGESIALDFTNAGTHLGWDIQAGADDQFFQNLIASSGTGPASPVNFRHFGTGALQNRFTAHNISFPNIYVTAGANDNSGPFQFDDPTTGVATYRSYIALKGISQTGGTSSGGTNNFALLDSYKNQYLCVELCQATGVLTYGPVIKGSNSDVTVRCSLIASASTGGNDCLNFYDQWNSAPNANREVCYCILDQSLNAGNGWPLQINGSYSAGTPAGQQAFGVTYSYRNSILGGAEDVNSPASPVTNGPFASVADAIQYSPYTQSIYISRATGTLPANVTNSNTEAQATSGVFLTDGSYGFQSAYASYAGKRGAIIS